MRRARDHQKLKDITDMPNGVAVTLTEHAADSVAVTFAPISTGPPSPGPGWPPRPPAVTVTATAD